MTRSISNANAAASSAPVIAPVWFVKLEFDDGPVCLHTQLGTLSFGGDEYTGAGDIGAISTMEEDSELSRSTLTLSLSGLPGDIISVVLNEQYQGRNATVFLGYLNPDTMQLVDTPLIVYRGRMDTASTEQGETLSVGLSVESRFAAWDRPLVRRYNNADQQARYPGDRGLEYVEQTAEKQLIWGPG